MNKTPQFLLSLLLLALILLLPGSVSAGDFTCPREKAREFDFWIGEWKIENRFLQSDGSWVHGGKARARITPVLGGCAILEQWSGALGGSPVIGFSLRAYDPRKDEWVLLLNWPSGTTRVSFGTLTGAFRHGRGEFFSKGQGQDGGEVLTRYSFSDTLPDSIRWDSATSPDGGVTWKTTWIMEFTRTAPREEMGEEGIFEGLPSKAKEPDPRATQLDFLLGDWVGTEERHGEDGTITRLDLRGRFAKIVSDYLVVGRVNATAENGTTEQEIAVCSFIPAKGAWEWWRLDESHVFERLEGRPRGSELVLLQHDEGRLVRRVTLDKESDGAFTTSIERSTDDGETFMTEKTRSWRRQ